MTHQYKQMQKEYNDELEMLTRKIVEREDELSSSAPTQRRTTTPSRRPRRSRTSASRTRRTKYWTSRRRSRT
jgi:hypothetical protein